LNQESLARRGFKKTHILGTTDGVDWSPLTASHTIELPLRPPGFRRTAVCRERRRQSTGPSRPSLAADSGPDGAYGPGCYGLSAVRFVLHKSYSLT
jgi:hypothetical protein